MPERSTHPTTPAWHLRTARPTDAPALQKDCLSNASLDRITMLLQHVQRNVRHNRGLGLVAAHEDGRLIGFGQLTIWPRTAEISDLIVSESWQNQGIGSALIASLLQAAREFAKDRVEIGVAVRNTRALALYQRFGFREDRTLELNVGAGPEPVMILWLDLDPVS
ncbi:GNAT family N-acetyltransferase [Chloroflexota bacterium]